MVVRRLKTYTSENGNVYEYYFVGSRAALPKDPFHPATEFIFDVTSGAAPTFAISIFLREQAIVAWQSNHGRTLVEPERYAAAKIKLFHAFDESEKLRETGRRLVIEGEELQDLLSGLGVN